MKKMLRPLAFILLFTFCVSVNAQSDSTRKVLLITDGSSFKAKTIKKITELSAGKDIEYRALDIKNIAQANAEEYDRYVILCKITGGRVQKDAYAFYQAIGDKNAILIGLTYLFEGPMPENAKREIGDIDAVTSASKKANVDTFAKKIVDWIITDQ
jgi:hypothetical protein